MPFPTTPTPASVHCSSLSSPTTAAVGSVSVTTLTPESHPHSLSHSRQQQRLSLSSLSSSTRQLPTPFFPVLTRSPSISSTLVPPPSPADSRRISTVSIRPSPGSKLPSAAVTKCNSKQESRRRSSLGFGVGLNLTSSVATEGGGPRSKRQFTMSSVRLLLPQKESRKMKEGAQSYHVYFDHFTYREYEVTTYKTKSPPLLPLQPLVSLLLYLPDNDTDIVPPGAKSQYAISPSEPQMIDIPVSASIFPNLSVSRG